MAIYLVSNNIITDVRNMGQGSGGIKACYSKKLRTDRKSLGVGGQRADIACLSVTMESPWFTMMKRKGKQMKITDD